MRYILFVIFFLIFTFSVPFPLFLQKIQKIHEIHVLESLDILIEETENGISVLEAWSVARNGESFLEVKDEKVSNADLRAIIRITKLFCHYMFNIINIIFNIQ